MNEPVWIKKERIDPTKRCDQMRVHNYGYCFVVKRWVNYFKNEREKKTNPHENIIHLMC